MSEVKYIEASTGPFSGLKFIGHSSAEEYDTEAGEVGACVTAADLSDIYRSLFRKFHAAFTPTLEKLSGQTRLVNADATAKAKARSKSPDTVANVLESFITFANRCEAVCDKDVWTQICSEATALASSMKCDSSPTERAAGVASGPGKAYLDKADTILARDEDALNNTVTKLLSAVDFDLAYDEDGKPERVSLARLVKAWMDAGI